MLQTQLSCNPVRQAKTECNYNATVTVTKRQRLCARHKAIGIMEVQIHAFLIRHQIEISFTLEPLYQ